MAEINFGDHVLERLVWESEASNQPMATAWMREALYALIYNEQIGNEDWVVVQNLDKSWRLSLGMVKGSMQSNERYLIAFAPSEIPQTTVDAPQRRKTFWRKLSNKLHEEKPKILVNTRTYQLRLRHLRLAKLNDLKGDLRPAVGAILKRFLLEVVIEGYRGFRQVYEAKSGTGLCADRWLRAALRVHSRLVNASSTHLVSPSTTSITPRSILNEDESIHDWVQCWRSDTAGRARMRTCVLKDERRGTAKFADVSFSALTHIYRNPLSYWPSEFAELCAILPTAELILSLTDENAVASVMQCISIMVRGLIASLSRPHPPSFVTAATVVLVHQLGSPKVSRTLWTHLASSKKKDDVVWTLTRIAMLFVAIELVTKKKHDFSKQRHAFIAGAGDSVVAAAVRILDTLNKDTHKRLVPTALITWLHDLPLLFDNILLDLAADSLTSRLFRDTTSPLKYASNALVVDANKKTLAPLAAMNFLEKIDAEFLVAIGAPHTITKALLNSSALADRLAQVITRSAQTGTDHTALCLLRVPKFMHACILLLQKRLENKQAATSQTDCLNALLIRRATLKNTVPDLPRSLVETSYLISIHMLRSRPPLSRLVKLVALYAFRRNDARLQYLEYFVASDDLFSNDETNSDFTALIEYARSLKLPSDTTNRAICSELPPQKILPYLALPPRVAARASRCAVCGVLDIFADHPLDAFSEKNDIHEKPTLLCSPACSRAFYECIAPVNHQPLPKNHERCSPRRKPPQRLPPPPEESSNDNNEEQ